MTRDGESPARLTTALAALAFVAGLFLLVWDAFSGSFLPRAHGILAALPLLLIAVAYLIHQSILRPGRKHLIKAILLASAFILWSANQLWPDIPAATLFNDLAIALFVLDLFLGIIAWPSSSPRD